MGRMHKQRDFGVGMPLIVVLLPTALLTAALLATGDPILESLALGLFTAGVTFTAMWAAIGPGRELARQAAMVAVVLAMVLSLLLLARQLKAESINNLNYLGEGVALAILFIVTQIPFRLARFVGGLQLRFLPRFEYSRPGISFHYRIRDLLIATLVASLVLFLSEIVFLWVSQDQGRMILASSLFALLVYFQCVTVNAAISLWATTREARFIPAILLVIIAWPLLISSVELRWLSLLDEAFELAPRTLSQFAHLTTLNISNLLALCALLYALRVRGYRVVVSRSKQGLIAKLLAKRGQIARARLNLIR